MKSYSKKLPLIKSDYFFKYLIIESVKNNDFFVKSIIEAVTSIKVSALSLSHTELPPLTPEGKLNRVDIHVIDESGNHYDIEMENGSFNEYSVVRFEVYLGKLLSMQEEQGKSYTLINPVYEIIFVNDSHGDDLVELYKLYNVKNQKYLNHDRYNLVVIYMPLINRMIANHDLTTLSTFERIVYIFQNNLTDDIIKLESKEVMLIMEQYEKFKQSNWYTAAEIDAQERMSIYHHIDDQYRDQIKAKDDMLKAKDDMLKAKDDMLKAKDETIGALTTEIECIREEKKALEDRLAALEDKLKDL